MQQAPGVRTTESHSYITVMGCLIDYQYIEVVHSGGQILVAVSRGCGHTHTHTRQDTRASLSGISSQRKVDKKSRKAKVTLLFPPQALSSPFNSTAVSYFVYRSLFLPLAPAVE